MNMSELPFNHAYRANDLGQLYLLQQREFINGRFLFQGMFSEEEKNVGIKRYTIYNIGGVKKRDTLSLPLLPLSV
jgi:hypothetical protein